ncbi:hypothetical protein D915_002884 [Fasciola hepatica]|uniref:Uncharacterized protein n=1 Tax=Fasciola hepatica TaxID=6192 RepID=A0A4E0RGP9_FASHE|nr:hypothetical protein D915_002884 [Fasciola hepatica]
MFETESIRTPSMLPYIWVFAGLVLLLILGLTTCGCFRMQRKRQLNANDRVWVRQDIHALKNNSGDVLHGRQLPVGQR